MTALTGDEVEPRGPAVNKGNIGVGVNNMTAAEVRAWLARRQELHTQGEAADAGRGDHAAAQLSIANIKHL